MTKLCEYVNEEVEQQKLDGYGQPIPILDENDDPVLDENDDPTYEMETVTVVVKKIIDSENLDPDQTIAAQQQAALDAEESYRVVSESQRAQKETQEFLIYDYLAEGVQFDKTVTPKGLNYKTQVNRKFTRSELFNDQGELIEVGYYADKNDDGSKDDLVLKANFTYTRDALGNVQKRDATREWYKKDGSADPDKKTDTKYYEGGKVVIEGKRRRENIVNNLEIQVLSIILVTQGAATDAAKKAVLDSGLAFMSEYDVCFSQFIKAQSLEINTAIDAANTTTYPWLIDTITQTVVDYGLADVSFLGQTVAYFMKDKLGKIAIP